MSRTLWPTALALVIAFAVPTRAQIDLQSRIAPSTVAWPLGALTKRFEVIAGTTTPYDLGSWAKVDGLDVTFDVVDYRSSGGTITLHRAAGSQSLLVQAWLAEVTESFLPSTFTIAQTDYAGTPVVRWSLTGVFPTKWSITSLGDGPGVVIETLVLEWRTMEVSCVRCG